MSLSNALRNTYKTASKLYINKKNTILSQEGTIEGDPIAMTTYGIASINENILMKNTSRKNLVQRWYDDDGKATGSIKKLKPILDDSKEPCKEVLLDSKF